MLSEALFALRFWSRRPLVAAAAVISLAVGIATATSVFAVADAALWRPLPLPMPERVVWVDSSDRGVAGNTSPGVFTSWSQRAHGIEAIAALRSSQAVLRDGARTQRLAGAYASASISRVLGLPPVIGRRLEQADDQPGAPLVMMIGERFWRSDYSASPDVLGRSVMLAGKTRTIIGVMPAAVDELSFGYDWWAPLALNRTQAANVGPRYLDVITRLGPLDRNAVAADLVRLSREAGAVGDTGTSLDVRLEPLKDHFSSSARRVLLPLLGAVLAVVLLAALNAAGLLLAQGRSRHGEIAVRASLGASRWRIVRQLLFESGWLAVAAAGLSLLCSLWMLDGMRTILPDELAVSTEMRLDWRSVLFTLALVAVVTCVAGVLPALRNSAISLRDALGAEGRSIAGSPDRLRRGFVILQVALAMTIGAAGALMARTTSQLIAAPRGYDADAVVTAVVQFPSSDYPATADLRAAIARIVAASERVPGVRQTAMSTRAPLSGGAPGSNLALVGDAFTEGVDRQVRVRFVTPGFFAAVGTRLVAGRDVAASDQGTSAPVVLLNETLARRLGSAGGVVGQSVKFDVADFNTDGAQTAWQVVGVVADTRDAGPRSMVDPEVYLPMAQGPGDVFEWIGRQVLLAARTDAGRQIDPSALRRAITQVEPGLALFDVSTLTDRLRRHLSTERAVAAVLVPLGIAGVLVSAFGLFTLLMQLVADRRRELAIRMALGATAGTVVRSLLFEAFVLTIAGAALGCCGAIFARRALQPLIFGVSLSDPSTLVMMVTMTLVTTIGAVYLPARRAASVDPAAVLRAG
ncbi:MAG: ABC transporter permease [Vicinamibacterales bacterium]